MHYYHQVNGQWFHEDAHWDTGYSGFGAGLNAPQFQTVPDVGPIPEGEWWIVGPPENTEEHGPYVLALYAKPGTNTFERNGFLIHGDEVGHVGEHLASKGCIILPRATRERIYLSGDDDLTVLT